MSNLNAVPWIFSGPNISPPERKQPELESKVKTEPEPVKREAKAEIKEEVEVKAEAEVKQG